MAPAIDIPDDRALVVVDSVEDTVAIAVDKSKFHISEEGSANKFIKEKLLEIARVLDLSMEDRLGELRSFIRDMVDEEKARHGGALKSKKKSEAQGELDKLNFFR